MLKRKGRSMRRCPRTDHRRCAFVRAALAFVLTLCLAVCPIPVSAAGTEPLKLTVAADTHYQCEADLGEPSAAYTEYMLDAELFGYASTQGQMPYESEAIVSAMLDAFAASDSPILLIAGDLTCGKRASHLRFAELLRRTEQQSGKQIFVIIGNHDCEAQSSENKISMEEFREIYADFGYNEALARHADSASYAVDLGKTHRLIAIDSCIYGEDEGKISASVFRFIREQTAQAKRDGRTPIAMMHHSLLPHYELQPMIRRWRYYAKWFADNGLQTVLTGHIHANDVASAVSDRGNTVYDVQTGALIASPNTYRVLTCTRDAVQIESRFITQIDVSLLPKYMTQQQKERIAADFPAYTRAYFENGVCKWMNRNLGSVDRLARWFKLKEGTKAYTAAEQIMQKIGAAVGQDIYGETNSIESALAPYGVSVPASDYRKPYQVAATIMYGFFHGDESTVSSDADTELLLRCIEGAVLTAMQSGIKSDALRDLSSAVLGKTAAMPASAALRGTAEKIALALLQTLAGGFTDDHSDPSDLEATLTFQPAGHTTPLHFALQLWNLFTEFIKRIFAV